MYFDSPQPVPAADGGVEMDVRVRPAAEHRGGGDRQHGDQRALRVGFSRASLSDAGDMKLTKGAAVPLEVTLTALDNAGILAHVSVGATPTLLMAEMAGLAEDDPRNGGNGNGGTKAERKVA